MKKTTQKTVTVGLDVIRQLLARSMSEGLGDGDPKKVQLHIGERDDGFGFPESGTLVLRKATIVVQGQPSMIGGLEVVSETTVQIDEPEVMSVIAAYVADQMKAPVGSGDVRLYFTPRHRGDHGYDGPFLDRAVVTVKNN